MLVLLIYQLWRSFLQLIIKGEGRSGSDRDSEEYEFPSCVLRRKYREANMVAA